MHKSNGYSQLTKEDRKQIEVLLQTGKSKYEIARLLGRSPSTIGRELNRNVPARGVGARQYSSENAHRRTRVRHQTKNKHSRFDDGMKSVARIWLSRDRWSPEIISAKGREIFGDFVSHEWLYQWIWKCKLGNKREDKQDKELYKYLRHGRRHRKRGNRKDNRGIIPNRVMIDKRPSLINKRRRIGDMEADLIMGKNHQPGLLILNDRKTRISHLEKINSKQAAEVKKKIIQINNRSPLPIRSITFDNDQAFAWHEKVAAELNIKTYFTHPYSSQEKGGVENRIGILRRFFPKQTDFTSVTSNQVKYIEQLLNNRPMRMFNYQSPLQVYLK